jgi:hypothetical protein
VDGDGYVDGFTCIHAGYGYEETGSGSDIWSHMWSLSSAGVGAYATNDARPGYPGQYIIIDEYTIDPERSNYSNYGTMVGRGVYCHEWGHALGLPDLYDTGGSGEGLGQWSLKPLVQALQALRGVQLIAAMTLVAELQDFMRFANPRQLMAYVGLVPAEHSSGPKRRQGSITKAGNSVARRMLVEVAWHYQHSPRVSPIIATRHDQLPKEVTDIAWKAQLRLNAKFKRLVARRVMKTKAVVAVARELAGFVWAIGQEVQSSGWQGVNSQAATPA